MRFGHRQTQLDRVVLAALERSIQDIGEFGLVANQAQQRFTVSTAHADAENVFGRGVERRYQECAIQKDNRGAEAINDGVLIACAETAAATAAVLSAAGFFV